MSLCREIVRKWFNITYVSLSILTTQFFIMSGIGKPGNSLRNWLTLTLTDMGELTQKDFVTGFPSICNKKNLLMWPIRGQSA